MDLAVFRKAGSIHRHMLLAASDRRTEMLIMENRRR